MKTDSTGKNSARTYRALWIALLALGIAMMFFRIAADPLWYDESYSVASAGHTIASMVPMIAADSHPPLYFIMLRLMVVLFGNSVFAVRSLSALGILALALLGFFPLRKLWGDRGGLTFTFLVLLTPMSVVSAHEARMYSWLAFFVTAMVIQGFIAKTENRKRDWLVLSLLTLGASYTHYYGLIAAGIYWLLLLVTIFVGADRKKKLAAFVATGATVVLYVPWLLFLFRQLSRVAKNYWIPPVDLFAAIRILSYPFMQKFPIAFNPYALAFFIAVLSFGAAACVRSVMRREKDSFLITSALTVYILTFSAGLILSKAIRPILVERYLLSCLGLLLLAFAAYFKNRKRAGFVIIALALFAAAAAPVLKKVYTESINGPMDIIVQDMKGRITPDDIFVHGSEHTFGLFSYYFPANRQYLYLPSGFIPMGNYQVFLPKGEFGSELTKFNETPATIWVVGRSGEMYDTPFIQITGADHRSPVGRMRRYSKQPGWLSVFLQEVAYDPLVTAANRPAAPAGDLTAVIGGVNPALGGKLVYALYDRDPIGPDTFIASGAVDALVGTVRLSLPNIAYGSYALMVFHDTNGNFMPDFKNDKPVEAFAFQKPTAMSANAFTFDNLKFDFTADTKEIDFTAYYP